jgi:hypothetical protein
MRWESRKHLNGRGNGGISLRPEAMTRIATRPHSLCGGCGSPRMSSPTGAHFPRSMLPYTLGVLARSLR